MVAMTGASGAVYAKRLLEVLPGAYDTVYFSVSENAARVMCDELSLEHPEQIIPKDHKYKIKRYSCTDLYAPPASGSHEYDGLVIIPCSMGTLGRVAAGISDDLITRAADVCIKERRKLILVVRETPLSLIHLRNMTALAEAGATILPASPGFYNQPNHVNDLVDFVVDRVLQVLGLNIRLTKGWGE
jgi:4-hydroxy-3-polyprenylbenzoate decarboxylase